MPSLGRAEAVQVTSTVVSPYLTRTAALQSSASLPTSIDSVRPSYSISYFL